MSFPSVYFFFLLLLLLIAGRLSQQNMKSCLGKEGGASKWKHKMELSHEEFKCKILVQLSSNISGIWRNVNGRLVADREQGQAFRLSLEAFLFLCWGYSTIASVASSIRKVEIYLPWEVFEMGGRQMRIILPCKQPGWGSVQSGLSHEWETRVAQLPAETALRLPAAVRSMAIGIKVFQNAVGKGLEGADKEIGNGEKKTSSGSSIKLRLWADKWDNWAKGLGGAPQI